MSMDTVASGHAQSANKTANENVSTDVESDLTVNSSQEISNQRLFWGESDHELNTRVIEYFLRFLTVNWNLNMISGLGVTTFWSWPGCWDSVLGRIKYPVKSELLTLNRMQSQETSNINIAANFLNFPPVIHMLQSDQRFRSYYLWNLSVAAESSCLSWTRYLD
jgi:hypothetical protein